MTGDTPERIGYENGERHGETSARVHRWLGPNSATSQMSLAVLMQAGSADESDEDDHCDMRYAEETAVCRSMKKRRRSKAAARCYASVAQRYAACLRGEHVPVFDVRNS